MGTRKQRSLLISLPACAIIALWLAICAGSSTIFGIGPDRLLLPLAGLGVISFIASIGHWAWSRASVDVVACFAVNLLCLLANLFGFVLVISAGC